jgi:hypothetical protein
MLLAREAKWEEAKGRMAMAEALVGDDRGVRRKAVGKWTVRTHASDCE